MRRGLFCSWLVHFFAAGLKLQTLVRMRNNQVLSAGRAIDRVPGPCFIGFQILLTVRTDEFHSIDSS